VAKRNEVRATESAEATPKKKTAKSATTEAAGTIKLTLVRSPIGYPKNQKLTVRALGLTRMNQTIEKADTPDNRGMAGSIPHLVRIEE
jgi:large subunit ribosomal protein L30